MQYESTSNKVWFATIFVFIITLLVIYFKIKGAPDMVALHYNVIIGVNEIGGKYQLLKIPLTGLAIGILNFGFAKVQKFDKVFLPFLTSVVSLLVNIFLLISAIFLLQVS